MRKACGMATPFWYARRALRVAGAKRKNIARAGERLELMFRTQNGIAMMGVRSIACFCISRKELSKTAS